MAPFPDAARTEQRAPALPSVMISVLTARGRAMRLREVGAALGGYGVVSWEGFCIKGGADSSF